MYKTLIVDDFEIVRKDIMRMKAWGERSGFIVAHEAKDGNEAIRILESNTIDLIISDIRMPHLDGIELLHIVKERNLCPFVVLLSEFAEFAYARQGIIYGAFDFLTKPLSEGDLLELLNRVAEKLLCDKKKADKIKKLEETIVETVVAYYPSIYIKQITECIDSGDKAVLDITIKMIDTTALALNNDIIKISAIIKNAINEIIDTVFSKNPWIDFFIDLSALKNKMLPEFNDLQMLKEDIYGIIVELAAVLNKLKCNQPDDPNIKKICEFILYNTDKKVSVHSIAKTFYINKGYLGMLFKQKTGKSLVEYINIIKMERAKKLLADKEHLKIYEISEMLGFKSNEYFSKLFKEYSGYTPHQYKVKPL